MIDSMRRDTDFSYACNACGRCCAEKVITLSPYDVIRIARASGISTSQAIARFTIRRGSILKFDASSRCAALDGLRCRIHAGRPLVCRLYPLGIERATSGDRFIELAPAPGSAGIYGRDGTVAEYLRAQGTENYFAALERYALLLDAFAARIALLVDFEIVEPREFFRAAARDALAESNFAPNELIDLLYDADRACGDHVAAIAAAIASTSDAREVAAAAMMLVVGLGYSPAEIARRVIAQVR